MELTPVDSSSIAAVGHDDQTKILRIRFTSLAEYQYENVPKAIFEGLMRAESKGHYFAVTIREQFKCECVVPRPKKEKADERKDEKAESKPLKEKTKRTRPAI